MHSFSGLHNISVINPLRLRGDCEPGSNQSGRREGGREV